VSPLELSQEIYKFNVLHSGCEDSSFCNEPLVPPEIHGCFGSAIGPRRLLKYGRSRAATVLWATLDQASLIPAGVPAHEAVQAATRR